MSGLSRSTTPFRWMDFSITLGSSIFRWPRFVSSYFTATRWVPRSLRWGGSQGMASIINWPEFEFNSSILDDVLWSLVTAFESVALVSMLCFFFLFCGCTI